VDDTFAGRPSAQRAICDAILSHLAGRGPVHVDAVKVGVFLKREAKLAEIRPMARSVSLALVLGRAVASPRVGRSERLSAERVVHFIRLTSPQDVDEQLRLWLSEAYDAAG
jgi:hypothetical protein